MDAVWEVGAVAVPTPPRRADGELVQNRSVEPVEEDQASSADKPTRGYVHSEAVLMLIRGSTEEFSEILEQNELDNHPSEDPGAQVDLYA
ncbi:MAG: hypothetical protein JXO22_03605 [Phycisphaerae bacterium]|nr:hypothetical protein [Phycisphaerae bacterium]